MKVSKLALAASLALFAVPFLAAPEADAQRNKEQQPKQEQVRLSPAETAAIRPLSQAVTASNWEAAAAALPAAQAGAQQPAARFEVGRLQFQIGAGTQNRDMQIQAVDAMLASGGAPASAMPTLLGARANFAIQASDWPGADQFLTRLLEVSPNDIERLRQAAEVKINLQRNSDALGALPADPAAVGSRRAAADPGGSQPHARSRRRPAPDGARRSADPAPAADLSDHGQLAYRSDPAAAERRGRPATGARRAPADAGRRRIRPGRRLCRVRRQAQPRRPARRDQGVAGRGIARGTVNANDPDTRQMLAAAAARVAEDRATLPGLRTRAMAAPTGREARIAGDTYFAYGEYAQAAELYRAALQKGGEDANLLNTRLGASLAGARQTADAQAAFRAVTGPRAPLAAYWLMWLERPATAAAPTPAAPTQ